MPAVRVSVPHHYDPDEVVKHAQAHIEKMIDDFDGHDLDLEWQGRKADFRFKSLAFQISGDVVVDETQIAIQVDLPLMAMIFKDRIEKAIHKNLTAAIEETVADLSGESNSGESNSGESSAGDSSSAESPL